LIDAARDPESAARSLYADLRRCDADGIAEAVVLLPAATGIGLALRDRVLKAAAGR
jgi:L-threonylcarbamoyladenylate synthase